MRRRIALLSAIVACALGDGCTFGSLADFEVRECNPRAATQSEDDCNRLNGGDSTCAPWQCDPGTRRCVQRPRDDDKDGDPSAECGGGDCVDIDPRRSSLQAAGPADVGPRGTFTGSDVTLSDATEGEPAAALLATQDAGAKCIQVVRLAKGGGPVLTGCSLLRKHVSLLPRQPYARVYAGGVIGAFVSTTGCSAGLVGFAYGRDASTQTAAVGKTCDAGAALPSTALAKSGAALVAWFETPVSERIDANAKCATLSPAPLVMARVDSPTDAPTLASTIRLAEKTVSTRPPALATVGNRFLVAAPVDDSVAIFLSDGVSTPTRTNVDTLHGARSVSLGVAEAGGVVRVAVIAEIGCKPQAIAAALGTLTASGVTIEKTVTLAAPEGLAIGPTIARPAIGTGWVATWITDGPSGRALRIDDDGVPLNPPYEVTPGAIAITASPNGSAFAFTPEPPASDRFVEAPLRCP